MIAITISALMDGVTVIDPERRYATGGWTTLSNDSQRPNQIFQDRLLLDFFQISQQLGIVFWGNQSQNTVGKVPLANADRALDGLRTIGVKNRKIEIRSGDPATQWSTWAVEYVGIIEDGKFNGNVYELIIAPPDQSLDRPLSNEAYASGALSQRIKPIAIGKPLNVPAESANPATLQFDCSQTSSLTVLNVRDQGDLLDPIGPPVQWTQAGAGFTLGQAQIGRITADVQGENSGGGDYDTSTLEGFVERVFEACGGRFYSPNPSIATLSSSPGYDLGFFANSPTTGKNVMELLAASYGAGWCFDKQSRFTLVRLLAPTGTPVLEIKETMCVGLPDYDEDTAPGYTPVCAAQRNWHVHSPNEVAGSVLPTTIGIQLQKPYRVYARAAAPGTAPPVVLANELKESENARSAAADIGIGTLLVNATDAQTEANRWRNLYAVRRGFVTQTVLSSPAVIALELGDLVSLTVPEIGKAPSKKRPFGLNATLLRVVGIERTSVTEIKLKLWG
jgi:hypothetical protein